MRAADRFAFQSGFDSCALSLLPVGLTGIAGREDLLQDSCVKVPRYREKVRSESVMLVTIVFFE